MYNSGANRLINLVFFLLILKKKSIQLSDFIKIRLVVAELLDSQEELCLVELTFKNRASYI
jgi:hypothetical protein